MSNWIGLPLSWPLPTMWNDVAACIACSTFALRSATEVLDPLAGTLDPEVLDPLPGAPDPFDGEPFVLVLQAAITAAQAMAAATLRCLRMLSLRCAG
jgi:hypothetical protein